MQKSMRLSDFSNGRDNNFNLIRIVAALAVLVTHSFALALGTGDAEPFRKSLGMSLGDMALDAFFITSGFLVTASLLKKQRITEYFWARALRIFPALLLMLLLTVFLLGICFTTCSVSTYLSSAETYIYFAKCLTLITGVAYNLPGVFDSNPLNNMVNGSLWTLPIEVIMYIVLALGWFALQKVPKLRSTAFKIAIVYFTFVAGIHMLVRHFFFPTPSLFERLSFMFFAGATFYILRARIILIRWLFWFFVISLSLATVNKHVFFVIYVFTIAYILLYIAYIPSGLVRKYNQLGDYSYGIYIYAWPVQQSIAALIPGVSVSRMIVISTVVTISLAALSWHFLEQRVLSLKALYIRQTNS